MSEFKSMREAANELGVSYRSLEYQVREGKIPVPHILGRAAFGPEHIAFARVVFERRGKKWMKKETRE